MMSMKKMREFLFRLEIETKIPYETLKKRDYNELIEMSKYAKEHKKEDREFMAALFGRAKKNKNVPLSQYQGNSKGN